MISERGGGGFHVFCMYTLGICVRACMTFSPSRGKILRGNVIWVHIRGLSRNSEQGGLNIFNIIHVGLTTLSFLDETVFV